MPKYTNETENFRHRGFDDVENQKVVMIFGDSAVPMDSKGVPLVCLWDHDVSTVTTVADHVV